MKKIYCDRCKEDCTNHHRTFDIPVHITEAEHMGYGMMIAGETHSVSGRDITYEVCVPCYNRIYKAAYEVLQGRVD